MSVPVITIDGPSGTGKGTMSALLAKRLGWHWLDSGSIYRAMAYAVLQQSDLDINNDDLLTGHLKKSNISVGSRISDGASGSWVQVNGQELVAEIRTVSCSKMASTLSALPAVRELVLEYQRSFAQLPGLVTDGRDMGSVVFPDARLKIYLTASALERAKRRQNQLQERGITVILPEILDEMLARDEKDQTRTISPTVAPEGSLTIDTSSLSIEQAMDQLWSAVVAEGLVESS